MTYMPNLSDTLMEVLLRLPGQQPMRYMCEPADISYNSPCIVLARFNEPAHRYAITKSYAIDFGKSKTIIGADALMEDSASTAYLKALRNLIEELKLTGGKTVISRILRTSTSLLPEEIFRRLCSQYPSAAVGQWMSGDDYWLVATPELLLTSDIDKLQTMSLAGTRPLSSGSVMWDSKNIHEQQMVTDYIMDALRRINLNPEAEEPSTLIAGPVEHICTRISASRDGVNPLLVASILAPTPAVAGLPKDKALQRIASIEEHKRDYYAGFFGISDTSTSNFFVTLRCMRLTPTGEVFIYVGSGITADSSPEAEWEETWNKARTLLAVLQ